ncbi:DUF3558 domain-containing protein [Streptomyces sp. NPDC047928]|uniref:DUF3558 domain-containing protein n=1 Tax=unclassified Streptomyces TaxID=2593676 RepID=UPI00371BF2AE
MQRRAYVPGLAVLLAAVAAGVTGCTAGSGSEGSATDSKAGAGSGAVAAPGRYRTLYEPCGSVQRSTLRDLLPGIADLSDEQRDRVLRGTPSVTYDNDRRAGCSWKTDGPDASHQLTIDFERVVSYDPTVSDDDRAQEIFAGKEAAAGIPARTAKPGTVPPAAGTPTGPTGPTGKPSTGAEGEAEGEGKQAQTATPTPASPSGPAATGPAATTPSAGATATTGATPEGLEPRILADLADAAFIDDDLARAGSTAQRRTVSVVFRTSNVIVTVRYGEQPARITDVPDSKELQEKAQGLARILAERFDE